MTIPQHAARYAAFHFVASAAPSHNPVRTIGHAARSGDTVRKSYKDRRAPMAKNVPKTSSMPMRAWEKYIPSHSKSPAASSATVRSPERRSASM